jgi:hypothetical protein
MCFKCEGFDWDSERKSFLYKLKRINVYRGVEKGVIARPHVMGSKIIDRCVRHQDRTQLMKLLNRFG